ncbi:MAG: toll/interleukin-1 receptor domain-containing protein [Acidobacteriia bacterium]|nr:toll/interleukin-1 receptor domain-containing protein [Terriglobia bacterium]
MDRHEALRLLRGGQEGIAEWNRRYQEAESVPDLPPEDLRDADLRGADLRYANLRYANLQSADLGIANLRDGNLQGADLRRANLQGAYLGTANLRGTDLRGADLRAAFLDEANLSYANLNDADLNGAVLGGTVFGDVDLSGAGGLESCVHIGPSVTGHRTLEMSRHLPLRFLQGCGLPDVLIDNIPALFHGAAIEFYSCFISYSSKDEEFARRLHADLQDKGIRCWFAAEDLKIGERTRVAIDEAIRLRDKVLLVLSDHSIGSGWVEREVKAGLAEEKRRDTTVLFPIRLDDAVFDCPYDWATGLRHERHIGDFKNWKNHDSYKQAFDRVVRDLKKPAAIAAAE